MIYTHIYIYDIYVHIYDRYIFIYDTYIYTHDMYIYIYTDMYIHPNSFQFHVAATALNEKSLNSRITLAIAVTIFILLNYYC